MKRYIPTILVVIILAALAPFTAHIARASTLMQPPNNNGLLAWWPLDENNGTVAHDLSGNGYNGTLNNFTTTSGVSSPTWVTGQFGNALSLNGGYAVATSTGVFNYSQSWTISAWVNMTTLTAQFPISLVTNTNSPSFIQFMRILGTGQFDTILNGANRYVASTTVSTGAWHNLMIVWDSSANTLTFYVDGASAGTTPVSVTLVATPIREFTLGARGIDFLAPVQGSLDDVRLYQRALSASEAANIYSGATVSSSNLIAWWKFDETGGYSAADSSGNGQTAYLEQEGWVSGKKGRALAFNGNEGAARSITTSLINATGDGTIAVWFRSPGLTSDSSRTEHIIVGAGSPTDGVSTNVAWIYLKHAWAETTSTTGPGGGGTLGFLWNCPNCSSGTNRLDTAKTYDDNQWHFAVMTQSGGTMTAYVDGSLVGTAPAATSIDATYPYYIGSVKTDSAGWNFGGAIDDVRVYNRALSATEVSTLYRAGQVTRRVVSNNGLVGKWTFDEGTSTVAHDFSGNGNTGTLTNAPVWTNGRMAKALAFNGTNQLVTFPNLPVSGTSDLTMSAWVKTSVTGTRKGILVIGSQTGNQGIMIFINSSNQAEADVSGIVGPNSTATVTDGKWHLVSMTKTSGTVQMYVDGAASGSSASMSPSLTSAGTNWIGEDFGLAFFNGSIDDVRIYNRALSAGEITQLYKENATRIGHSQENVLNNGLVGYWSFNGPDIHWNNNTAIDHSPQNNNGTLTNMSQSASPVSGRLGQALTFVAASSQYVDLGNPASLQMSSGGITISAWVKYISTGNHLVILSHGAGGYVSYLHYSGGNYYLCWASSTIANNNCSTFASLIVPNDGKWHLLTQVNNIGSNVLSYIDGQLKQTTSFGNTYSYSNNIRIGYSIGDTGPIGLPMNGALDEVRIYNRALSALEVNELYRLGK